MNTLKLREDAKPLIGYVVGNDENMYLWYDNWHPKGPFLDRYGARIMYDFGLPNKAKVKEIISNGGWKW